MTPRKDEVIDLQKLTQRELLIKLNYKVESLDLKLGTHIESTNKLKEAQDKANVELAKLETKVKLQSSVWGAITGTITGLFGLLIKILIK